MDLKNKEKISFLSRRAKIFFCVSLFFFALGIRGAAAMAESETFLVNDDYDYYGRSAVPAFLAFESDHAYLYLEQDYFDKLSERDRDLILSRIKTVGEEFDATIYPTVKEIFGNEWDPGIDQDGKIVIFFDRMDYNVGGYFNPNDEYDKDGVVNDESNEHEMIYINPEFFSSGKTEGFLAHEFQHMVYWNEKYRIKGLAEEVWINEARSELASALIEEELGKRFSQSSLLVRKSDFLSDPSDSLVDWENGNSDYASVSLFMQYVKDKFGTDIFQAMNATRKTGANNLNYVLEREKGVTLAQVFTNWTLANYINDVSYDSRDGYDNANLKTGFNVSPTAIYDKDGDGKINLTGTIENWSADYYRVDLSKLGPDLYLAIRFDGDDFGDFALPVVINYADGSRRVDLLNLDGKQAGGEDLVSLGHNISSLVFIPESENLDEALKDNQVKSYGFSLEVGLSSAQDRVRPDGSLVRVEGAEKVYVIESGKKRWIADAATFVARGYDWSRIIAITPAESALYAEGETVSSGGVVTADLLLRGSGPEVYLVSGTQRHWIQDAATFVSLGYTWDRIRIVSDAELQRYAEGEVLSRALLADGSLVRGSGPQVYLIAAGKKRWITSPEAFSRLKFSWSQIVTVPQSSLTSLATGPNID